MMKVTEDGNIELANGDLHWKSNGDHMEVFICLPKDDSIYFKDLIKQILRNQEKAKDVVI